MELLKLVSIALLCLNASAWVPNVRPTQIRTCSPLQAAEAASLKDLGNHEEEGSLMAESIIRWLDDEWMPQEVHVQMAESAKNSYVACRNDGQDDVMDVLMRISTDLESNWAEYDADAFVNAWDVGNYAADYLIKRSGSEGCDCSAQIH